MEITQLKEYFDVEHYHLVDKSCYIAMVDGVSVVTKYAFRNADGETKGRSTTV